MPRQKESPCLFWVVRRLHKYISGLGLTITGNHRILQVLFNPTKLWPRIQMQWSKDGMMLWRHTTNTLCIDPTNQSHKLTFCLDTQGFHQRNSASTSRRLHQCPAPSCANSDNCNNLRLYGRQTIHTHTHEATFLCSVSTHTSVVHSWTDIALWSR